LILLLIRHADAAPGEPDALRSLTPAGQAAARALGERLHQDGPRPEIVLSSPLLRARETAAAIARALGVAAEPNERLAPGASADDVRAAVTGRGEVVAVVGHQPDCGDIAAELTGRPAPSFPPGHLVAIEL
jgi:phosphohistidine phosphatase